MTKLTKLEKFAEKLEKEQAIEVKCRFPALNAEAVVRYSKVIVKPGKKYTKVDVGTSGKFMVDENENIFGIKGYGQVNKKKQYGTLDTINQWYWGGYTPEEIPF